MLRGSFGIRAVRKVALGLGWLLMGSGGVLADGQGDNKPESVRPVPPPGVEVSADDRSELEAGITALGTEITALRELTKNNGAMRDLLPDVQIFHNAARYALIYNEFFKQHNHRNRHCRRSS